MREESAPGSFDLQLDDRPGQAYNESAFRHFLSIETKRSERSGRPFGLLLVDLKKPFGRQDRQEMSAGIDPAVATRLFTGLSLCLRETDFVGWYHEERVAGAVLTQLTDSSETDVAGQLRQRVSEVLFEGLLPDVADRLQIRIFQLPAQARELGENRS